jgi:pimeloyl-[acyl-carrier protein] synthase
MPDQDFNPHDPTFLADPYPTYARLRDESPVVLVQPYNSYWVLRYDDAISVLTDTDTYVKNPPAGPTPTLGPGRTLDYFPDGLFGSDPPRHTELRAILEPLFQTAIDDAPTIATALVTQIIDHARVTGYLELIADYAIPVPSTTLFTILGVPQNQPTDYIWPGLIGWVTQIAAAHDITQSPALRGAGGTCLMAVNAFYQGLVADSKQFATTGLVAKMIDNVDNTGALTPIDVQVTVSDLTVAGYLSTTFLIGTGVRNLIANPEQAALLREQPALIHDAIEEMLRFDAPAQLVDRVTAIDTDLRGVTLPAGTKVSVNLGSANHDPEQFTDPDLFLINRDDHAMVAFGDGIHTCIGAPLVRLVGPVAIGAIAALPDLQLDGIVQWQTDPYLRAVTNLPIRFG